MNDALRRFREAGYVVLEGAIEPALVADLREGLRRLEEERGFGFASTAFEGRRTVRIYNLLAYGEAFQRVPIHPRVLPLVEAIMDEGVQLSSLSAITLAPGQEAQPLHADSQLIPLPRPHPTIAVNAMWALTDFTDANGATRVVPGSHRFDQAPAYGASYETIAAEMPAGSVMLFDSQLWHGGGANRTDDRRWAIACYYCAGWVRQQENQQLGLPHDLVARFPRRLQELCGWSVYRGLYGHVENRDPIELLGQPAEGRMVWEASERKAQTAKG